MVKLEVIKELAGQARKYARDYVAECRHYGHYMEHNEYELRFAEKFAELVVRECVSICKDKERPNLYGVREVETAIKQHFGVEE